MPDDPKPLKEFDPSPWRDEAYVWRMYLRLMANHGEVTLLPQVANRISEMLAQAEAPGTGSYQIGAGWQAGVEQQKAKNANLKCLAALAINKLVGGTIFSSGVTADILFGRALESGYFPFDDLTHAPKCPANHWGKTQLPTGPCNCGIAAQQQSATDVHQ